MAYVLARPAPLTKHPRQCSSDLVKRQAQLQVVTPKRTDLTTCTLINSCMGQLIKMHSFVKEKKKLKRRVYLRFLGGGYD